MPLRAVFLDAGPLSEVVRRPGQNANADTCRAWVESLLVSGVPVFVGEITDYEVRRELLRSGKTASIGRLDAFLALPGRYVPLSTDAMRQAATLWGPVRNAGLTTASPDAIDGDVILAA